MTKYEEGNSVETIEALLQHDPEIQLITKLDGDRQLAKVPIGRVLIHDDLKRLRAADPANIADLRESMNRTGGSSIYTPTMLALKRAGEDRVDIFCTDGHQRLRAEKENGSTHLTVMIVLRWASVKQAMQESMSLGYMRFEPTDEDTIETLATNVLTKKEVAIWSGKSETTVERLNTIAQHHWLRKFVKDGIIGSTWGAKLIDATNKNPAKLAALKSKLETQVAAAELEAKKMADRIAGDRKHKWDAKSREKAKVKYYFRNENWRAWLDALEADDGVKGGQLILGEAGGTKAAVIVGGEHDWKEEVAVYNLFGQKHAAISVEGFDEFLDNKDDVIARLMALRDKKAIEEGQPVRYAESPKPAQKDTVIEVETPPEPVAQKPNMRIKK